MPQAGYTPGDVVRLRSGGPLMTVESLVGTDAVLCCWFGHNLQHFHSAFANAMLMPAMPPEQWPARGDDD